MPIAVHTYRDRLEEMTAEAMEEYYLHAPATSATYEIAAVYERYADLTTLEQAQALADRRTPRSSCTGSPARRTSETA